MQKLMEKNPEVRQMLSNPSYLQQISEAMSNPNVMKEMMRNHDRQLSNIESIPGGFNYLTSMYQSLDDALFEDDAFDKRRTSASNDVSSEPSRTLNVDALPNPWASDSADHVQTPNRANPFGRDTDSSAQVNALSSLLGMGSPTEGSSTGPSANPMHSFMNPQLASMFGMPPTVNASSQPPNFPPTNQASSPGFPNMAAQLSAMLNPNSTPSSTSPFANFPFALPPSFAPVTPSAAPQPTVNPEEKFKDQLQMMKDMGFDDQQKCIRALYASAGDVESAIQYLLERL